jgi:propanediol dehydratase small subunit
MTPGPSATEPATAGPPTAEPSAPEPSTPNPVDVTTMGSGAPGCDNDGVGSTRALSGRAVADVTVEAMRTGEVDVADLRIHPDTLERQATIAEEHANPQLAENLRRAAELTRLPDEEVLAIYESLRPGRSTRAELTAQAESLAARGLPRCAALLTEAADVYARRGLSA